MKKLENNFTTPEQSKRLLELGVPADSADCYRRETDGNLSRIYERWTDAELHKNYFLRVVNVHPCWSVGRLMEIYKIVGEEAGQCISCSKNQTQVESLVQLYEENIDLLDFSKLEE